MEWKNWRWIFHKNFAWIENPIRRREFCVFLETFRGDLGCGYWYRSWRHSFQYLHYSHYFNSSLVTSVWKYCIALDMVGRVEVCSHLYKYALKHRGLINVDCPSQNFCLILNKTVLYGLNWKLIEWPVIRENKCCFVNLFITSELQNKLPKSKEIRSLGKGWAWIQWTCKQRQTILLPILNIPRHSIRSHSHKGLTINYKYLSYFLFAFAIKVPSYTKRENGFEKLTFKR